MEAARHEKIVASLEAKMKHEVRELVKGLLCKQQLLNSSVKSMREAQESFSSLLSGRNDLGILWCTLQRFRCNIHVDIEHLKDNAIYLFGGCITKVERLTSQMHKLREMGFDSIDEILVALKESKYVFPKLKACCYERIGQVYDYGRYSLPTIII